MNFNAYMHTILCLQKMDGVCSKKELSQLDTMLPLNPSTDEWKEAQPVTKISDSMYPFSTDKKRPTINEVRCAYGVHLYKIFKCSLLNKNHFSSIFIM